MKRALQNVRLRATTGFLQSFIQKPSALFCLFTITCSISFSQSITPATINAGGNAVAAGNYQFEWSIGEASSIITLSNSNIVVTTGVLQAFAAFQPDITNVNTWLPGEVKIYPVPAKDVVEINMLTKLPGKTKIELFNLMGKKVMEKEFYYGGLGATEKWNLSTLPSGQYFINIQLLSPVTGAPVKKGAFKILKIQ